MIEELTKNGIRRDVERYRGDRFRIEPSAPWVARRRVMNIERQPGEPVTALLMDRQIHAPSNARYTRVVRRLETHQAVQDLGTVELGFDPATQQLVVHGVSVFRAGELTNHAVESAFELFQREAGLESDILNGALTTLLVLKDIRIGDVLDLEFTVISDSPLLGDHYWFTEVIGNVHPIGRQWLSWIEREDQPLFVQAPAGLGSFQRETTPHGSVRTWSFEHTPVVALEPDLPITYKAFPEISITTFSGWDEVAALFLQPWSAGPADRSELETELVPLRRLFAADPIAGIAAATDLVRHQIRYLGYSPGIFALVPADPGQVWRRRFGDCKEKSRLLCWLLRELGADAVPVLVNSIAGAGLENVSPSPGAFDHVVVRLRHDGNELWIDPTDVARRGDMSQWKSLPFHFGLPLESGSRALVRIPAEAKGSSGLHVEEIVMVDSKTRGATITVTHTYRGTDADMIRHAMDSRGRSAVADYLTDLVKRTRPDAAPDSELAVTDDSLANRFTLSRKFRCEDLLKPVPDGNAELFFIVPHAIPPRITGVSATRKHPLAIPHPVDVKHTIRVNAHEPRSVVIPRQSVSSEFFSFSFTTTHTRTETVHDFVYQSKDSQVPAAKARAYSADLGKVAEAFDWHLRFPPRKHGHFRMRPSNSPDSW